MPVTHQTREGLIQHLVTTIQAQEGKPAADCDRAYLLDLVAEVANAIDGKKPGKPMNISAETVAASKRKS